MLSERRACKKRSVRVVRYMQKGFRRVPAPMVLKFVHIEKIVDLRVTVAALPEATKGQMLRHELCALVRGIEMLVEHLVAVLERPTVVNRGQTLRCPVLGLDLVPNGLWGLGGLRSRLDGLRGWRWARRSG